MTFSFYVKIKFIFSILIIELYKIIENSLLLVR